MSDQPIYFKVWRLDDTEEMLVDDSYSNTARTFETVEEDDAYREFDTYDDAIGFAEMVAATLGYSVRNETIPF